MSRHVHPEYQNKSVIAEVEMGNITAMLESFNPVISMTDNFPMDQKIVENNKYVGELLKNSII